jgi:CheY-like chemotaxis protein
MLAYSGKGHFVVEDLHLSDLVEENAQILRTAISKNVRLELELAGNLPRTRGDASQLQQVTMNLITNAAESFRDGGGVISLRTGVQECDSGCLSRSRVEEKPAPGWFVYLEVEDTGCGMDEPTQRQLFDPFFTTKFTGRGLGMSALQGIVRGHGGAILLDSQVGRGTTIRVLLPISEPTPAAPAALGASEAGERLLGGTVLAVDDEPMVLALCRDMLRELGFDVVCAEDGEEALRFFGEKGHEIRAVLLDLTMPRMDGIACFQALRAIRPDVKVLLSTGYSEIETAERFAGYGFGGVIQKPYSMARLRTEFTRLLGAEQGGGGPDRETS